MQIAQISPLELSQILTTTSPDSRQLIDVREDSELDLANLNDLGFRHYPLSDHAEWSQRILSELDAQLPTYVLCHHGMRSAQMCQWLVQQGFSQPINIVGGIAAWADSVDPTVPQY